MIRYSCNKADYIGEIDPEDWIPDISLMKPMNSLRLIILAPRLSR